MLGAFGIARAQGFGRGAGTMGLMGGSPENHLAFMKQRLERGLDLVKATDSQKTTIRALFETLHQQVAPLHQQMQALHAKMADAFSASSVDANAVESLRQEASTLHEQISKSLVSTFVQAGNVLSQEQRKTLVQHMQQMRQQRGRFRF